MLCIKYNACRDTKFTNRMLCFPTHIDYSCTKYNTLYKCFSQEPEQRERKGAGNWSLEITSLFDSNHI